MKIVFTGPGKGKTSAAAGIAFRSWGHGRRVLVLLFLKDRLISGEWKTAAYLSSERLVVQSFGRTCPYPGQSCCPGEQECIVTRHNWDQADQALAEQGLELARQESGCTERDLIILDEILNLYDIWPDCRPRILQMLDGVGEQTDLILTGRFCCEEIMERVDLVTCMEMVKHPFNQGITAKEGIDF